MIPRARSRETTLPIVRDNYRINKFTSCWNAYNISTSAKWYRDTVVYHCASYRLLPVTHCPAYVVSSNAFGSHPLVYGAYRALFGNRWHFKQMKIPENWKTGSRRCNSFPSVASKRFKPVVSPIIPAIGNEILFFRFSLWRD